MTLRVASILLDRIRSIRVGGQAMTDKDQLALVERQLDRILNFFPRVDGKATGLFAVASAELAVLLLNLQFGDFERWYVAIPVFACALLLSLTFFWLYRCSYPHLEGGKGSLIYFQEIATRTEGDYRRELREAEIDRLIDDLVGQIWRNSEILKLKFGYLKKASISLVWSLLPFGIAIAANALIHSQIPLVKG